MHRALLITAALIITTPAFADSLFDQCYKLALDRVGPVSDTHGGHFKRFVRECVQGKIPGGPTVPVVRSARGRGGAVATPAAETGSGGEDGEGGRVLCVKGSNGGKYCY
jgi:hypothetical protein